MTVDNGQQICFRIAVVTDAYCVDTVTTVGMYDAQCTNKSIAAD